MIVFISIFFDLPVVVLFSYTVCLHMFHMAACGHSLSGFAGRTERKHSEVTTSSSDKEGESVSVHVVSVNE